MNDDITVLRIVEPINEGDGRIQGVKGYQGGYDMGPGGVVNPYDWRVWSGSGYGKQIQNFLGGGYGYSYEVCDMGKYVMVRASYNNSATGKAVSKMFAIVFQNPKMGDAMVFATSTKWRTVSNPNQAANYIKQTIQSMSGSTQ